MLFEWHSLDEIDPTESVMKPVKDQESFDYFHINSVEELEDGDIVVSARHTSAVYRIDRETGTSSGGWAASAATSRCGTGTEFGLQHDARDLGDGVCRSSTTPRRTSRTRRRRA